MPGRIVLAPLQTNFIAPISTTTAGNADKICTVPKKGTIVSSSVCTAVNDLVLTIL
jgi:hypothetical protein